MMARNRNVPFKGRIQKRKTYHLQIITFGLQRAAGPYRRANNDTNALQQEALLFDFRLGKRKQHRREVEAQLLARADEVHFVQMTRSWIEEEGFDI